MHPPKFPSPFFVVRLSKLWIQMISVSCGSVWFFFHLHLKSLHRSWNMSFWIHFLRSLLIPILLPIPTMCSSMESILESGAEVCGFPDSRFPVGICGIHGPDRKKAGISRVPDSRTIFLTPAHPRFGSSLIPKLLFRLDFFLDFWILYLEYFG